MMNTTTTRNRDNLLLLYVPVYLIWFLVLEQITPERLFVVSNPLDTWIPFCEYFVVPYVLWFPYLLCWLFYFYCHREDGGFFHLGVSLIAGLTFCLLVYTVFPNAQELRPEEYPRQNLFVTAVAVIQRLDPPINVCPSMHIFSTVAVQIAVGRSRRLGVRVKGASLCLAVLICMSTVLLKQHSLTDVLCAFALNAALWMGERYLTGG